MLSFLISRLLQAAMVMLTVAFVCFLLFNFVGDPVSNMVGQEATPQERAELRADLGLDDPVPLQFARFVGNAVQGHFGKSYRMARPVRDLIIERMPATLELVFCAAVLALLLGIPLGVLTALRRDTWGTRAVLTFSLAGVAMPTFVIGILLIYVFSVELKLLPSFGRGDTLGLGWWSTGLLTVSGLKAIVLPAITLSLFQMTLVLRLVRSEMLEVLRTDYIKFARARGLTNRAVHFGHALKNTLLPVITVIGLQIGGLIAFSIITETVFQWPGMGSLFISAVGFADIPVMSAYLVMVSFFFVAINLLVDILYAFIDPRLRIDHGAFAGAAQWSPMPVSGGALLARWRDSDLWWSFTRSPLTVIAAVVTLAFLLGALLAPLVAPQNPFDPRSLKLLDALTPPLWKEDGKLPYLLGSDNQGRDVLSGILYGCRISLVVGFAAVLFSVTLGVLAGLTAGFRGGWVDNLIMRAADIQLTVPAILIALTLDGVARVALPKNLHDQLAMWVLIFAIGFANWPQFARVTRATTLAEKSKDYVAAARIIGIPAIAIAVRHVLPNVIGPVLVIATIGLALAIIAEASLSYLGVGMPPTQPSLGTLIRIGNSFLFSGEWWIVLFPALALVILSLAVNLLGDWLRDALNPRLR